MRIGPLVALAASLGALGCGGNAPAYPYDFALAGTPDLGMPSHYTGGDIPAAGTPVYRILANAGSQVTDGYSLTANVGASYRLVVRGITGHHYTGSVWTSGHFTSLTPGCNAAACAQENDDYVSTATAITGGQRVDFDLSSNNDLDGFDFVADAEPVFLNLLTEGSPVLEMVIFPATDKQGILSNVGAMPFGLTTQ